MNSPLVNTGNTAIQPQPQLQRNPISEPLQRREPGDSQIQRAAQGMIDPLKYGGAQVSMGSTSGSNTMNAGQNGGGLVNRVSAYG
jgi:hypothetical protein